jgi:hypothetical protein
VYFRSVVVASFWLDKDIRLSDKNYLVHFAYRPRPLPALGKKCRSISFLRYGHVRASLVVWFVNTDTSLAAGRDVHAIACVISLLMCGHRHLRTKMLSPIYLARQ